MSLQTQLRLIAAITALSLLGVILFSVVQLSTLRNEFNQYQMRQIFTGNLAKIKSSALLISRSDPVLQETEMQLSNADNEIQGLYQEISGIPLAEIDSTQLKQVISLWNEYSSEFGGAIKMASTNPADALQIPDWLYKSKLEPMITQIDQQITLNNKGEARSKENISGAVNHILWIIVLPLIAAALIVITFQAVFNNRLKNRIDGIIEVISHLSAGDLSHRLPEGPADEIGIMVNTINEFLSRIESILHDVNTSADQSKITASKINVMTQSVSSNSQAQSTKIFSVMSAIEKMGLTITEIANNANCAARTAQATGIKISAVSQAGQESASILKRLDQTVESSSSTIQQFEQTLQQIGNISNVIKEIAEQTNLLALNAAIEAARAGEHGRGFAVVAGEVRILSERTTVSAQNISGLLAAIQTSSREAVVSMNATRNGVRTSVIHGEKIGIVLSEAETSMQTVAKMMMQIAQATEIQSQEGRQIATHIADVTQITTSNTKEIETTQREMAGLTKSSNVLQLMVSQFRLSAVRPAT